MAQNKTVFRNLFTGLIAVTFATSLVLFFLSTASLPRPPVPGPQPAHHHNQPSASAQPASHPQVASPQPSQSLIQFPNQTAKLAFEQQHGLADAALTPSLLGNLTFIAPLAASTLTHDPNLAAVHPRISYSAQQLPNDPQAGQWYLSTVKAPAAWDISTGSPSTIVAVIDTGFALNHQDLSAKWAAGGWDFVHNDNNPQAGTDNPSGSAVGHGSQTAGLAGAATNNGIGTASVGWQTKVLPLQALSDSGSGFTDTIVAAINYATTHGANVISMSLGSASPDSLLQGAIDNAISEGITVVAAAGNCGSSSYALNGCSYQGQMLYPGNYPEVISVGASQSNDTRASFSSWGPNLSLLAPGNGTIVTTTWTSGNQTSAYTSSIAGTSFATPIVASAAALLHSQFPALTPAQIKNQLLSSADKVAEMGGAGRTDFDGSGRLDVAGALGLYQATEVSQSADVNLTPGQTASASLRFQNSGDMTWYDDVTAAGAGANPVHLATTNPINRASVFGANWGPNHNRPDFTFSAVYESDGTTLSADQHIASPGQIVVFNFSFTTTATTPGGNYAESFAPVHENDPNWSLAATGTIQVTVASLTNRDGYAGQSAYPSLLPGDSTTSYFLYKNTGTTTWYDDTDLGNAPAGTLPVHLATANPTNRASLFGSAWGGNHNRPDLTFSAVYESDGTTLAADQHSATPGQIVKFSFSIQTPVNAGAGTYREYFRPVLEGSADGGLNDPGTYLDVTVQPAQYIDGFVGQSAYPTITHGSSGTGYFLLKNLGNMGWYDDTSISSAPAGTLPVHLATSNPLNHASQFGSAWGANHNRPDLNFTAVYESDGTTLASDQHIVAPGQIAKLSFTFNAPNTAAAGVYREYFRLVLDGSADGVFNDLGAYLDVTVQ